MAMPKFVAANFKLRHVRLENGVARHVPKDAGVFAAALQPRHHLRRANVFYEISFVPTLAHALGFCEVVRRAAITISELKIEIVDQAQIAEDLQHERKTRNG